MLSMKNVSKVFRTDLIETHALRDFSLEVKAGEFLAVTGPSGSGKTTFLNIAGLLEPYETGSYKLDDVEVTDLPDDARSALRNQKIGFIFQSFNLMPDLNIYDNVDVLMARQVMDLLERINEMGTTIIMVTHDPELARRAHRNVQVVDGQISDFKPYEPLAAPAIVPAPLHAVATAGA